MESSLCTCSCECGRTICECLHRQVYDLGEDPGSNGWRQERGLFVWLPELLQEYAGQGQPQLRWSRTWAA